MLIQEFLGGKEASEMTKAELFRALERTSLMLKALSTDVEQIKKFSNLETVSAAFAIIEEMGLSFLL